MATSSVYNSAGRCLSLADTIVRQRGAACTTCVTSGADLLQHGALLVLYALHVLDVLQVLCVLCLCRSTVTSL